MASELAAPPALSTPAEHILDYATQPAVVSAEGQPKRTDDELREIYEVARTAREAIELVASRRAGGCPRVALQFPDSMLCDAPRVVGLLQDEFAVLRRKQDELQGEGNTGTGQEAEGTSQAKQEETERIYVLADTSYSPCCVDEIAAEHADSDVVVHYGRACLSPTSRLPVIYVFTKHSLDRPRAVEEFEAAIPDKGARAALMADVTYQDHVMPVFDDLKSRGYSSLVYTKVVHNPLGRIPNRTLWDADGKEVDASEEHGDELKQYTVFHISAPPTSLLLALSSRIESLHIFPTSESTSSTTSQVDVSSRRTRAMLGRRYARVLTLSTAGIIGILVNTLSVANYLDSVDSIRKRIAAAGKKSYTVVVGKLNPAKLANFAEIDGWVVVGCWESSLVEDDAGFYRPVITPFELEVALMPDDERVWGDRWWGGIEGVTAPVEKASDVERPENSGNSVDGQAQQPEFDGGDIEDEESAPPEFDLRTGRLVSNSRPMRIGASHGGSARVARTSTASNEVKRSDALALRPKAELATVRGVASPGAEFLRSQRTWQGLGTDFDGEERNTAIEEGRSGVARGYTVGDAEQKTR